MGCGFSKTLDRQGIELEKRHLRWPVLVVAVVMRVLLQKFQGRLVDGEDVFDRDLQPQPVPIGLMDPSCRARRSIALRAS
jgi:hypothetical protein